MISARNLLIGSAFAGAIAVLGLTARALDQAAAQGMVQAPKFEVDPMWPKPLPNNWLLGNAIGVWADAQDNVWIVHRADTVSANEAAADEKTGECCRRAPPVLRFNQAGEVTASWGGPGPGYDWPNSNHGITVDHKGFVWIGGNVGTDAHVLKFTQDGKFVAQFGKPGQSKGSNDPVNFSRVAKIFVDPKANEAYIADGYGNRRVAVIDADSGVIKRYWGAYGEKPHDDQLPAYDPNAAPIRSFRTPVHCADLDMDGLLYVCDRPNNRMQVFTREGKFVDEFFIAKKTGGDGAVWDIAFSKDPEQKYMYIADGKNERIYIYDRKSRQLLSSFGDGGRQPGQWFAVHSIATDSRGNIYTTETYEGKRLQKFVFKGVQSVPRHQGVPWPVK
jgi:DNA-binding beta-propeller fold protein YncE